LVQFQKFDPGFGGPENDEEVRQRKELTWEDAQALKTLVPAMAAVSPERYWSGGENNTQIPDAIYGGNEATPDQFAGVTEDYAPANNRTIAEGRFINATDVLHSSPVVVIGFKVAETLFPNVDPIGRMITISGHRYLVIGVFEEEGATFFESSDLHVVMPLSTYDAHYPWIKKERGVTIATIPRRPEWVDRITEEGTAVLRARRRVPFNKPNDFGIMTPDKLIDNFRQITGGIALAMVFISSIALLIGGIGVMNIMLVSVTERTREIGLRKAIGALRRDIVTQFLIEAMTLSGIGGIIGIIVGIVIAAIIRAATPLPTETPLWSILTGFTVSVSIGLFFGIYPAYKAAKLDPVEALRYE
ncbi:MAG TPA: ABC transporter permease, partial [Thermoanaerobaculia bacterium]|nr:ABC transporter permease [Thermoanaerobaculia bacterium]